VAVRSELAGVSRSGTIPSPTLGEIEAEFGGDGVWLTVRDSGRGVTFEASRLDDGWRVVADELTDFEREALLAFPRSPDEFWRKVRGRSVVESLRTLRSREFRKDRGGIPVNSGRGFDYLVCIDRLDGGSLRVEGARSDSGETVLRAELRDGVTFVRQADFPRDVAEALEERAEGVRKKRRRTEETRKRSRMRKGQRQRQQDDEISL